MSASGEIRLERVFDATPEEVFEAWSDAESLGTWMCPGAEMESATVELDFRVGGRFRIAMHDPDRDYVQHGEYLEIDPPKRIVLTWVSEWIPPGEAVTRLSVTFEPEPDGKTRLVLVHDGLPDGDAYAGHPDGWSQILTRLEAALRARRETT